jgi:murein DD-endopeptidase MepM/ murein hydrolase activator NlpD
MGYRNPSLTFRRILSIFPVNIFRRVGMPQEGTRQKKSLRRYDVMIVPAGEGGGETRTFRTGPLAVVALCVLAFLLSVAVTLGVLIFTPLAMYVPIPNPGLEERYGRQILDTQRRLNALAEDVVLLSDYNAQLRKALGEGGPRDTSVARALPRVRERDLPPPAERPLRLADQGDEMLDGTADEGTSPDGTLAGSGGVVQVSTLAGTLRTSFPLSLPAQGFVTQGFNPARNHFGLDIAGQSGTPVFAAGDGIVVFAGWTYDDGNMVIIAHGAGYLTMYKHNKALLKRPRDGVRRGETIALLGTSGKTSLGPHLHFEVWKNGLPQNPADYLFGPARAHQ